jgi:hypothetical protein
MKLFLSWSGERSQAMAEALRDWLPKVIQAIQPWMSAVDIDRGARWSSDIAVELEQTSFGILCLTPENLTSAWIHFEAGALSKTLEKTLVCPYLFELEPADLNGPLVQFNAAKANKEDTWKLLLTINDVQETPLPKSTLDESFEVWWPKLEEKLIALPIPQLQVKSERPEREILEEILGLVREQTKTKTSVDISDLFDFDEEAEVTTHLIPAGGFPTGSHVRHPKYGRGLVMRREGKGDTVKLTVSFPGFGQKKLIEKYAGLSRA